MTQITAGIITIQKRIKEVFKYSGSLCSFEVFINFCKKTCVREPIITEKGTLITLLINA